MDRPHSPLWKAHKKRRRLRASIRGDAVNVTGMERSASTGRSGRARQAAPCAVLDLLDTDELFARSTGGDQAARDQLVRRFLPLARKLARRYVGARRPLDNLL